jgi:hypothetical protein
MKNGNEIVGQPVGASLNFSNHLLRNHQEILQQGLW